MIEPDKSNESVELRKEKIKNFFRNNSNILLFLLVGFTVIFKLYYFFKLGNQPIWWDEGDYLAISKVWAINMPTPEWMAHFTGMRPLLLPIIWAAMFKIGFGESMIRFFTLLIPSIGSVIVTYLLGKELYNKNVGFIAGFMFSSYWVWSFYSFRLLTDIPAVFFGLLSLYFFWGYYINRNKPLGLYLCLFFGVLGFSTRFPLALIPISCVLYLLVINKLAFFKNRTTWKAALFGILFLSPYLIYFIYTNFAALRFYFGSSVREISSIGWANIPLFLSLPLLFWEIAFLIGFVYLISSLLYIDVIWKQKTKQFNPSIFLFIGLFVHLFFYVFILKVNATDRWLLMLMPYTFIIAGSGLMKIYHIIKRHSPIIAIIVILTIIGGGAYQNIIHSTDLIESKKTSYIAIKDSGEWLKENTPLDSKIMTPSVVQNQYYSERDSHDLFYNTTLLPKGCIDLYGATVVNNTCQEASEKLFNKKVLLVKPDYLVISVYEPVFTPQWAYNYAQKNSLVFIKAFFQPENPTQPVLIIYQFPKDFNPVEPGITTIPVTNDTNITQKSNSSISNKTNSSKK